LLAIILALIAAGLFFILINQGFLAILCIIAAVIMGIANFFKGTKSAVKKVGKGGTRGMWKDFQEAETGHPDKAILDDAVSGTGQITGQEMGSPDSHKFKTTGSIEGAAVKIIETFKKAFK